MNQKTLIGLGAAALVAVVAALVINHSRKPVSDISAQAGALVPGLREHVNDVSKLAFTGANNQPIVTLERGGSGWKVAQKGGYPADLGKLRDFLLKLGDANLIEQKTANKDRYTDLGVDDISNPAAKGMLVEIDGLVEPARFIVGTFNGQGGGGTFVRRASEAQSWLAKGTLVPEKNAAEWLQKDLADIPSTRIASVTITRADGKTLRVFKNAATDAQFSIADVPKGREPSSEFMASGLASVLAELRLDDVAPATEIAPSAQAIKARYATFDGLVVDAVAWQVGEKHYAGFKASLDTIVAEKHIADEQAKAGAEHAVDDADNPAEEGAEKAEASKTGESAKPLAVSDSAKDREQRLATLDAEVAMLNASFDGWSFVLPAHKASNIDKSMDDMLKPVEAKAPAKPAKGKG
jgi:hypothetical protein